MDGAHPEALSWVEDYLRTKRDYSALRDVLLGAVRAAGESIEGRKERLREVAGLCEGNLRDIDGAINAWKQLLAIDRVDDGARQSLTRLFEKTHRWDDLAHLLEQEATVEADLEKKISLEKKLAALQESKRQDFGAAAEAWSRIANLTPEDDNATLTASKFYEKTGALDRAAQIISDTIASIVDPQARGSLLERLGDLREQVNDPTAAAEAYAEAAELQKNAKLWDAAERCLVAAEKWDRAAHAATQRAELTAEPKLQAQHHARAAEHFGRANDESSVVRNLERAAELDPANDDYAAKLEERYSSTERWADLVQLLLRRAERLADRADRVAVRRKAADLYATKLSDREGARDTWLKVLEDGDDKDALEKLVEDAVAREDHTEATTLLRRLGNAATDQAERARIALREAEILAEGLGDVDTAIACYERILADLDPTCRPALQAIADLQEARDEPAAAAVALERELKLVAEPAESAVIARRLGRIYEGVDRPKDAIRVLEIVRKADSDDFEALTRLCELCEKTGDWEKLVELLAQRIEYEADEAEMSALTKKLADVLAEKLDRGDEALAALTELADMGDGSCRDAYILLGDRLGWRGIVATKLVEWWFEAKPSPERTANLRGAFDRFAEVGREQDAVRVACEIVRSKGSDRELAERLEQLSIKTSDLDALAIAHDLLARDLSGVERAKELVRQAEARVKAGAPRLEALQHGEAGLTSVPPSEAEPLLARLAEMAEKPGDVVDLYERQITRCKAPVDRVRALARAAQVASVRGQLDRARGFFDLALSGTPSDETLAILEEAAREGDAQATGERLRRALASAMAAGGQGSRDGGRTRGALMRRAASMAHRDLDDLDSAFTWLGDALIAYVEPLTLDSLEGLAREVGDVRRAEATLSRALGEVFDGPLVRQLYARRAKLRREYLDDRAGAAADLKKLHDLAPSDQTVMDELSALLTELGDYRGMVQLYEDHILRGKDMAARAELARKVARMWEEQLADPREAADAWRRVLRMKPADPEATAGLERAKTNMLKKPDPGSEHEAYAPPKLQSVPQVPPSQSGKLASTPQLGAPEANKSEPAPESAPAQEPAKATPAPRDETPSPGIDDAIAAATATPSVEETAGATTNSNSGGEDRPSRPSGLYFSPSDEITVSTPGDSAPELDRGSSESVVSEEVPIPREDDLATTGENNLQFSDSTLRTDPAGNPPDRPRDGSAPPAGEPDFEEEVIIADDLAEMVDVGELDHPAPAPAALEDTAPEKPDKKEKKKRKRSLPPPVPRGG